MDWKNWLFTRWGMTGTRRLVAKLKADPSLSSERKRVRAFIEQEGGCRATYYNLCLAKTPSGHQGMSTRIYQIETKSDCSRRRVEPTKQGV